MKKAYVTLIIIIILLSLPAACATDAGIRSDIGLLQQSQPSPLPTGWPEVYSSILEEYKTLADLIYHDDDYSFFDFIADNEDAFEWQEQNMPDIDSFIVLELVIDGSRYRERDDLGYALEDLNGDGSDELILLSKKYWVFAVYSTVDGKPKLLDFYWDRYRCHGIDKSNLLYIYCFYDSSEDWYYAIQRLSNDGSEFLTIEQYGMESFDYYTRERYPESHYYKVIDGKSYSEREFISKTEFDKLYDDWEKAVENADNSGITFIPILDCDNSGSGTGSVTSPAATDPVTPKETVKIEESKKPRPDSASLIDRNRELFTLKSEENYVIYRFYNDDYEEDFFYYRIEVYNDDGKMIFHDEFDWPEPIIDYVSKDVIQIDMHTGTGCSKMRYCDVKSGLVSEVFDIMEPILFVDGILIQRGNGPGLTLTAENVFDKTAYYKEFIVDPAESILEELRLIDEQTIEIEYLRCIDEEGSLDKKYTATIALS